MSVAKLTAWLGLDGSNFKAGIDGASKKVVTFERQMNQTKRGLGDIRGLFGSVGAEASSMGGVIGNVAQQIAGAFGAGGLVGVIGVFASAVTGAIKIYESSVDKALAKTRELVAAAKERQRVMNEIRGINPNERADERAARIVKSGVSESDIDRELKSAKEKARFAEKLNRNAADDPATSDDYKNETLLQLMIARKTVEIFEAAQQEMTRAKNDAEADRIAAEDDAWAKQLKDRADAQKAADDATNERRDQLLDKRVLAEKDAARVIADAHARISDVRGRSFSSEFGRASGIETIGATIGGRSVGAEARTIDIKQQRDAEILRITRDANAKLAEIADSLRGDG